MPFKGKTVSLPPIIDQNTGPIPHEDVYGGQQFSAEQVEEEERRDMLKKTLGMSVPNSEIEEIDVTARRLSTFDQDSNPIDHPDGSKFPSLWDKLGQNFKSSHASQGSKHPGNVVSEESVDSVKFGYPADDVQDDSTDEPLKSSRFRVLARMVKNNLTWARELRDKHEGDITKFVVKSKTTQSGEEEALVFDLNNFRFGQRAYGGLTARARRILLKHPIDRTKDELFMLKDVVDRLKCFQKYPRKVKHELSRVIYYEHFEDGRVIIQQGHLGISFYFILTGKVLVHLNEKDKSGNWRTTVLGELGEGSSFGELALLHNIKRTATIVCKGRNCEFLRVDKADFESVLRQNYSQEWCDRFQMLKWLSCFKDWPLEHLHHCNNMSKTKEFLSGAVIYRGWSEWDDNVYFVMSGECQVIREILLVVEQPPYKGRRLSLPTPKQLKILSQKRDLSGRRGSITFMYEKRYWQICTLKRGYYFGTGENLTNTFVVASDRVEVLLFPRILFARYGQSKLLERMREDLDAALPSTVDAYNRFKRDESWKRYKQQVVQEVIGTRSSTHAKVADVPKVYRQGAWRSINSNSNSSSGPLISSAGSRKSS